MDTNQVISLLIALGVPFFGGFINSLLTPSPGEWYNNLKKPSWTPPGYVFPIVWTTLYLCMGYASWLVWRVGGFETQWLPLSVYAFQLVLNFAWTPIFFGSKLLGWALFEIILLWLAIFATIFVFWPINHIASYLLFPYILWVSLATTLCAYIYFYNLNNTDVKKD